MAFDEFFQTLFDEKYGDKNVAKKVTIRKINNSILQQKFILDKCCAKNIFIYNIKEGN